MKDGWLGLRQVFIVCFPSAATCYDNATENCGGNEVTGVSTAQDCCLGNGYWFWDPRLGGCLQCIGEYLAIREHGSILYLGMAK